MPAAAALEKLAWSGACDDLAGGDRRVALWQLGVTAPGVRVRGREGVQLALALDLPAAPKLEALSAWDEMVADYATTGLTASTHPIALLRARACAPPARPTSARWAGSGTASGCGSEGWSSRASDRAPPRA